MSGQSEDGVSQVLGECPDISIQANTTGDMSERRKRGSMSRGRTLMNYYALVLGPLYDRTPKAVCAAIGMSYFINSTETDEEAVEMFLDEWRILHKNGIVRQAPPPARSRRKRD